MAFGMGRFLITTIRHRLREVQVEAHPRSFPQGRHTQWCRQRIAQAEVSALDVNFTDLIFCQTLPKRRLQLLSGLNAIDDGISFFFFHALRRTGADIGNVHAEPAGGRLPWRGSFPPASLVPSAARIVRGQNCSPVSRGTSGQLFDE